jgi:hypothetical protein
LVFDSLRRDSETLRYSVDGCALTGIT